MTTDLIPAPGSSPCRPPSVPRISGSESTAQGARRRHVRPSSNAFVYRVQDMDRHGFRVAVYRHSPYPPMLAEGYLKIETP